MLFGKRCHQVKNKQPIDGISREPELEPGSGSPAAIESPSPTVTCSRFNLVTSLQSPTKQYLQFTPSLGGFPTRPMPKTSIGVLNPTKNADLNIATMTRLHNMPLPSDVKMSIITIPAGADVPTSIEDPFDAHKATAHVGKNYTRYFESHDAIIVSTLASLYIVPSIKARHSCTITGVFRSGVRAVPENVKFGVIVSDQLQDEAFQQLQFCTGVPIGRCVGVSYEPNAAETASILAQAQGLVERGATAIVLASADLSHATETIRAQLLAHTPRITIIDGLYYAITDCLAYSGAARGTTTLDYRLNTSFQIARSYEYNPRNIEFYCMSGKYHSLQ
jgi:Asp/Glu/hydantoin racemase